MLKSIKYGLSVTLLLITALVPVSSVFAYYSPQTRMIAISDPQTMVCRGLAMSGLGCGSSTAPAPYVMGTYQPKQVHLNFDIFSNTSASSTSTDNSNSTTAVSNAVAPKDLSGQKINLVSVPNSQEIYELVNGQKHPFPSFSIYYDYGYTLDMIQPISQEQLDKYPRASLVKVKGNSKIYYLTEGGMVRRVINTNKIFEIYGDRKEDVITISRKEFNYYPTNEYVYQFSPLNRDVFQISTKGKRYLTPMAVYRLGISPDQIAPVSKLELDSYKTLAPLVD
ncbi:MAG: hypothetical protein AAB787_00670 [Patescibacteria group bacterium]